MGFFPVLTRARVGVLTLAVATTGVLFAQAGPAAAAPAPTTPHSSSSKTHAAHASTASRSGAVTRKPNAVAPPPPTPTAPPCTTGTGKPFPVICLPKGSGEDRPASLTPGDQVEFDAQVVNQGLTTVKGATVTITLPQGLELESDEDTDFPVYRIDDWYSAGDDADFTDLDCSAAAAGITCDVGDLDAGDNILIGIDLQVADDAKPGTTLRFGVTLHPDAELPAEDTSVDASIDVLAPSHLVVSLTPATLSAVVGHTATMVGSVHNAGSGPAPNTTAIALAANNNDLKDTHFTITNGQELTADPTDGDGGSSSVVFGRQVPRVTALLRRHAASRAAASKRSALPSLKFWPVGTLAAGATSRVTIQLKARSAGEDSLTFGAFSQTDDSCDFDGGGAEGSSSASATPAVRAPQAASRTTAPEDCSSIVQTHITAVAASNNSSSAAPLANTGSRALDVQLGIAVWSVVVGGLLVWFGRRRRTASGRHLG